MTKHGMRGPSQAISLCLCPPACALAAEVGQLFAEGSQGTVLCTPLPTAPRVPQAGSLAALVVLNLCKPD